MKTRKRIVSFLLCGLLLMFLGLCATETAKAQCNVQRSSASSAQSDAAALQNAAIQQQLATLRLQAAAQPVAAASTATATASSTRARVASPQKAYLIVSGAPVQAQAPVRAPSTPPPAPAAQLSTNDLLLLPVATTDSCDKCRRAPFANLRDRDRSVSRSVATTRNGRTKTKAVAKS